MPNTDLPPAMPGDPPAGARRTAPPRRIAPAWPLAAAALGAAAFVAMDASVKLLSPRYGAVQLTFLRFVSGLVFALALWAWLRSPMPARREWRLHALRCGLLMLTLVSYFHALTVLPLAQAVAIGYTAPIFISVLAVLVLHERPSRWIWVALALGAAGSLLALWPELRRGDLPRLWGLAAAGVSALSFSAMMVLARVQAQRDALGTIVLLQNLLPALALAAPAALAWQPLHATDLPVIGLVGALATVGLLGMTWAFRHVEASRVAPVEYTGLLWAGLLGWALFGEVPSGYTLASAALIVGGCLLLLRR